MALGLWGQKILRQSEGEAQEVRQALSALGEPGAWWG